MNQTNSLAEIQSKYKNCNLLMPVANEVQLNPFYKYTVMEVKADLADNSGDIFKVGSVKVGESYKDVFSPAKPLLMKLAAAAGIQFDPNNTYGNYISRNCYKAKAYGAMRMPDGTGKTHCDEKVINLDDEEDNYRLEFMDKSLQGITEKKAAEAAAKLFKGEWFDTTDKWGKACKAYKIADEDRQKYIDRSVLVNMTLLRKTMAEKAMTGAILRVIRALIGMKGTYTKEELAKPFAIPRVTFSPDYNDPQVRNAMLSQGMNSVSNMFGASPMIPAASGSMENSITVDNFNPEEFAEKPAFASENNDISDGDLPFPGPEDNEGEDSLPWESDNRIFCEECEQELVQTPGRNGKTWTPKNIRDYSMNNYNRCLCFNCQKKAGAR
jgi:hypothetical protein